MEMHGEETCHLAVWKKLLAVVIKYAYLIDRDIMLVLGVVGRGSKV